MPSADADEDAIQSSPKEPNEQTSDDDQDEAGPSLQFLTSLASYKSSSTLPRRGLKDFAPNPTDLQASALNASRDAMHAALSHTRTHVAKNHIIGLYDDHTGLIFVRKPKSSLFTSIGKAVGGKGGEGLLLEPEEALWLLERGSIDIWWPSEPLRLSENHEGPVRTSHPDAKIELSADVDDDSIPLSLQAAYALFIGGSQTRHLTSERYQVYANLKRSGFIVQRAEGFSDAQQRLESNVDDRKTLQVAIQEERGLFGWLLGLFSRQESPRQGQMLQGPLVKPGLYRTYADIYRLLQIIPSGPLHPSSTRSKIRGRTSASFDSNAQTETSAAPPDGYLICASSASSMMIDPNEENAIANDETDDKPLFTTHYNLYRPQPHFRKTQPGPADFRLCVVDARSSPLPTLSQLHGLLCEQPAPDVAVSAQGGTEKGANKVERKPGGGLGGMYKRVKQSGRGVILAIVDEGVVSYLRIGEAGFADESDFLWREGGGVASSGGKGKSRGGRNGGGRGRVGGQGAGR